MNRFGRTTRLGRRTIAALGTVGVLALAGGAYAYFSGGSASGTGSATVGSPTSFTVTTSTASGGPMYPGGATATIHYKVNNPSSGAQYLTTTTTAIAEDANGDITQGGNPIPSCKAAWFSTSNSPPAAQDIPGGGMALGEVVVSMADSGTSQDLCQTKSPDVTISAS